MSPAIRLHGVTRTYTGGQSGTVHALGGIDLTVQEGEYVAIVGPSGAGKSSLLNILGCLDRPSSGQLEISGSTVEGLSERDLSRLRNAEIGFVFQAFNLIPALTARANVELPMLFAKIPRHERLARTADALERVGLAGRAGHRPSQLSGGQQQRVAIARAIVNRPSFILADEPTGNLDSEATNDVLDLFDELHARGATVVIITHEDDVAMRAQRVIVMRDGRIAEERLNSEVAA